jgi:HEAT repeat protein
MISRIRLLIDNPKSDCFANARNDMNPKSKIKMTSPKLATLLQNLNSDDANIRSQTVITLGQLGDEQAIPNLCQTLLNDSNPEVRRQAAEALGKLASQKTAVAYQPING